MPKKNETRDPYSILGVAPNATADEVIEAYKIRSQLLHPDKINRAEHPRRWEAANSMLRDIIWAKDTLIKGGWERQSPAGGNRGGAEKQAEPRPPPPPPPQPPPPPPPPSGEAGSRSEPKSGAETNRESERSSQAKPEYTTITRASTRYRNLPKEAKAKLKTRLKGAATDQIMLKKSGAGFNLAMAALGVFILAHVIFATTTKSPALFIFWAASAAATAFATHNAAQFLRKTFSRLPSALIVTPCHFIETGPDGVSYTPITDYYKISVSEMTKENKYKVEFEVSGRKTRFTAFCANGVKQIIFTINSHRRRAEDLLASCSLAELARHDDLNGLNVNADRPPPPRRRFPGLTIHVVAQAACLILYMDAAIHLYFPSHHKTGAPAAAERIIHR